MVVEEILGVKNDVPVPSEEPPDAAAYQLIVPADADACNTTVPVPHLELSVVPVIAGTVVIVAVTGVLGLEGHPFNIAST